jgi:hypothetical protein
LTGPGGDRRPETPPLTESAPSGVLRARGAATISR